VPLTEISDARGWGLSGRASSPRRTAGQPPHRLVTVESLAGSIGRHGGGGGDAPDDGGDWSVVKRRRSWSRRAASSSVRQPECSSSSRGLRNDGVGRRRTRGTRRRATGGGRRRRREVVVSLPPCRMLVNERRTHGPSYRGINNRVVGTQRDWRGTTTLLRGLRCSVRAGEEEEALRERDWCGQGQKQRTGRDGGEDGGDKKEGDDSRGVALRGPELLARDSYRRARLNSTIYPGFHTRDDSCVNPVHPAPNRDGLAHSKLSAPPAFPDAATFGSGGGR
jgi:hypothetical protein